ncbi:hypothetical protein ECDEC1B_0593 [Escherichia coli DEC1B]|nr:hypothetical protein ECDEC1B_0593 [Escherichia coli DEC1B]
MWITIAPFVTIHPGNLSLHVNLLPLQIYDVRLSQNSYQRKFDDRFQWFGALINQAFCLILL